MTTKVTPTGTIDWYIKWVASILILIALSLRASGFSVLKFKSILAKNLKEWRTARKHHDPRMASIDIYSCHNRVTMDWLRIKLQNQPSA